MALFVLGAGATRGCSFVNEAEFPCLPPLDTDFFTQLQRVKNDKHQKLISAVMADVVELFGTNFHVTMETVFTTLEHTIRMLETTGDNRDFRRADLKQKRERLQQAIAVVMEESLTEPGGGGGSSLTAKECQHHKKLVVNILQQRDHVITFNYDCVLDCALRDFGKGKWNPRYGYGFNLGSRGKNLSGDSYWAPSKPAKPDKTVRVYKLHGSLHFDIADPKVKLKERPYTKQHGSLRFTIIPPEWHKTYDKGVFAELWKLAANAINHAEHVIVAGYSLPPTDLHSTALFRTSIKRERLKALVIVNPDKEARYRIRTVLQRGLTRDTRVLSFDSIESFVAADRRVWAV